MTRTLARLACALIMLCAAPMAACAGIPNLNAPLLSGPAAEMATAAEYDFEATYNVAAFGYLRAVETGELRGPLKARIKTLLQQAKPLVLSARAIKAGTEAGSLPDKIAAIRVILREVMSVRAVARNTA